jgi:HD-GYP domain-containing protein (c-di-GMP phosphodiesterase class II)
MVLDLRSPFVMREDLFSCDGTLIVRQGEIITNPILQEIQERGQTRRTEKTVVGSSDLLEDFRAVLEEENYQVVFDTEEIKEELLTLISRIPLSRDIYQELELFKVMDHYTYRHILITSLLSTLLVKDFFTDPQQIMLAGSAALTHDFGKSRIPIEVLQSARKLDYEEFLYILEHPWISFLLLAYYTGEYESIHSLVAFNHHEKNDGSGYPRGVKIEDPIIRLVTVCDMFDALISPRTYRVDPFNIRGALDFLYEEATLGRLEMTFVKLLISYNRHSKTPIESMIISQDNTGYRPSDEKNNYSSHEDFEEPDLDDGSESTV